MEKQTQQREEVLEKVKNFEKEHNCEVMLLALSGSRLYGTHNENSDTDYKGIFIPRKRDVLLKKDIPHFTSDTNESNEKNSKDDIDFFLNSFHKFIYDLSRNETGAVDLMFSMFYNDAVIYQNKEFVDLMKANYKMFLTKNVSSFSGYALEQAKKYGIKGKRYGEIVTFQQAVKDAFLSANKKDIDNLKINDEYEAIQKIIDDNKLEHVKFVQLPGGRGSKGNVMMTYISVVGKRYVETLKIRDMITRINSIVDGYGERAKASFEGTDWKALSHAWRIASELIELIENEKITFPLKDREYIKSIKYNDGKDDKAVEAIKKEVEIMLNSIDDLIANSDLPTEVDEHEVGSFVISTLERFGRNNWKDFI